MHFKQAFDSHCTRSSRVVAEPQTAVMLQHHDDDAGPGAGRLLNNSTLEHSADLLLNCWMACLWDAI